MNIILKEATASNFQNNHEPSIILDDGSYKFINLIDSTSEGTNGKSWLSVPGTE
jgi:hypothetical protein